MVAKQSSRQFVCAALLLLVAACGGEQPDNTQSIFDNPPADASNVTVPSTVDETGDTTSEQTTTTTVVVTTTTDVETDAETSGGDVPDVSAPPQPPLSPRWLRKQRSRGCE